MCMLTGMKRMIAATESVHASQERCQAVLLDDPGTLLGDASTAEDRRFRCFRSVLSVDIGSGASVRQEVEVRMDAPRPDAPADTVVLPLRLHATGRSTLFPTFTGELTASPAKAPLTRPELPMRMANEAPAFALFDSSPAALNLLAGVMSTRVLSSRSACPAMMEGGGRMVVESR